MESYVDEYDNHAFGIFQEDGQNGFDAYPKGFSARKMKLIFHYDADTRVFSYRDFNTMGMGHCNECNWGVKPDRSECTNPECGWGCFHNVAYSGKGGALLGSRGLGKSPRIMAGLKTIVRTTLPDGRCMASTWAYKEGDWAWQPLPELIKKIQLIYHGICVQSSICAYHLLRTNNNGILLLSPTLLLLLHSLH